MKKIYLATTTLLSISLQTLQAQNSKPNIDSGDTAWMIVATALVLLMSIPGLALFYGGLVRRKNVLNIFMQVYFIIAVVSVEWVVLGYSNAFSSNSIDLLKPLIGGFDWAFLSNIKINDISPYFISHSQTLANGSTVGTIPHIIFVMFQGMFAAITPALIVGAFAERINFKGFVFFSVLWSIFIYNPIAHWVWSSDGWLFKLGALDFAGGTVVHVNAGAAAIVMALLLGKRRDYKGHALPPHNITYVAIGTGLLWVGWFGFNAGSGLAADGLATNALMTTHISAATAALTWAMLEWFLDKRPTVIGISTGAVAGLVAATPAAGFIGIPGAITIGILVSMICFAMVAYIKPRLGYDDSLDAFGVHGVGGILGAILTGLLATPVTQFGSSATPTIWNQLSVQLIATVCTFIYSAIGTFLLYKLINKYIPLRISDKKEATGLDESEHGETAYTNFD